MRDNSKKREKHIIYIGGSPYESEIVYLKNFNETTGSYKFSHKDYLGSILAISDEAGNKVEQRHYDAWGNLTHLQYGNGEIITDKEQIANSELQLQLLIARGYTSHEHLFQVGLIHMNGRLYDPLLRRFLNADEHIQDPYNTQNYNKYGYVYNNPLMYNDPSGEFVGFIFGAIKIISAIFSAVQIVKSIDALVTGTIDAFQFVKGLFFMAVSKIASVGLGDVFKAGGFWETVGNGALAGAGGGGVQALMNNENFFKGLVKGAVIGGSIAAVSYGLGKLFEGKNSLELDAKGDFSYDGQQFSSKQELLEYIQKNNGDVNTIMRKLNISDIELASEANLPKLDGKYIKMEKGFMVEYKKDIFGNSIKKSGSMKIAKTIHENNASKIWVSPGLKGVRVDGHYMAKSILNHEFIHARHVMLGLNNTRYLERSAWSYNYAYARYHNLPVNGILKHLNSYGGFHIPKNYMWSNLGLDKFVKLF